MFSGGAAPGLRVGETRCHARAAAAGRQLGSHQPREYHAIFYLIKSFCACSIRITVATAQRAVYVFFWGES